MTSLLRPPLAIARARLLRVAAFAPFVIALSQLGCGASPWQPPAPYGATYQYDHQGFVQSNATVAAGGGPGYGYGAAFAFRSVKGVHEESGGKDPFAQSVPIDGLRFNDHLGGQGARLQPGSAAPGGTNAPSSVSVSASASVSVGNAGGKK